MGLCILLVSTPRKSNTSSKSCSANSARGMFQSFFLDDGLIQLRECSPCMLSEKGCQGTDLMLMNWLIMQ
uniref:Uncharacterized protein n=1 Tax=Accipiter nisus TaxID=211598 RepID=A0A8B9NLW2_9AVES